MGQIIGLKAVHAGNPLPKGVKDAEAADLMKAFTKISQPYKGGVSTNFAIPSSNDFYREGEATLYSAIDETTGTKEVTWNVVDFDDDTMEFYFGTTEPAKARFTKSKSIRIRFQKWRLHRFCKVKYVATLGGGINKTDPLQIQVSAKVLAPEQGGYSWWPITTPEYTKSVL